jgi:hypothetical protein
VTALSAHGLSIALPPAFEGRIYLRDTPTAGFVEQQQPAPRRLVHQARTGWAPEQPHPVLHLANFALPANRGDFGTGAVEIMSANHVFLSVLEYGQPEVGSALFAGTGMPLPQPADMSPNALQRRLAGQAGWQRFFTVNGRAFCAYVVIGAARNANALTAQARSALTTLRIGNR